MSIPMIHILRTAWGEVRLSESDAALYQASKRRRDGQPDRRTKLGRMLWSKLAEVEAQQRAEYLAR